MKRHPFLRVTSPNGIGPAAGSTREVNKGDAMRKIMVLPLAGLLALGVVGPVAAAPNVSNTSGGGESIYGEWSTGGGDGYASVGTDSSNGGFAEIYQESGTWVACDPGAAASGQDSPTTQDTTGGDGDYGFVGTRTWGYSEGDVTFELARRLDSGHATGSIELATVTVDECAGDYGGDAVSEVVAFDVSVSAAGPLASFRDRGTYKVPSQFNGHQNYRGKERAASGTVTAGSSIGATFSNADMTVVTWSDHSNG
jgi:hypothetical protein